jgi:hypothetical protein
MAEADMDDLILQQHALNQDRQSVVSEADSIRSISPEQTIGRETDNSSPIRRSSKGRNSSKDYLQSPNRASNKKSQQNSHSSSPQPGTIEIREFHVLVWIAIRLGMPHSTDANNVDIGTVSPSIEAKENKLKSERVLLNAYLNSLNLWLENQKDWKAKALYRKAPQKSLDDVERTMCGMLKSHLDQPYINAAKGRLVEAVKSIFRLFLPLEQRNPMCFKLWGTLHSAITASSQTRCLWKLISNLESRERYRRGCLRN